MIFIRRARLAFGLAFVTLSAQLRRLWYAGAMVAFLLVSAVSFADPDRVILIFGDSLSTAYGFDIEKSWVSLLERRLNQKNANWKVVNASVSGETTRGGLARIKSVLDVAEPDIVIVELGGNDGLRGINLDATENNLSRIVEESLAADAAVLLLAMELPPNYGPSYIERFRRIYQNIASKHDVRLVPFFLDGVAGNSMLMQSDGIHPQAEAQPMLLDNVWPHLEPSLGH